MSYLTLPQRVFNSPIIEYANFSDGSHVNIIQLSKPYANGVAYAVHETTNNPFCSNGLFKTYREAKEKFDLIRKNHARGSIIVRDIGTIDHTKPFPNNVTHQLYDIYVREADLLSILGPTIELDNEQYVRIKASVPKEDGTVVFIEQDPIL